MSGAIAQPLISGSTFGKTPQRKPIAQDVVLPVKGGQTSTRGDVAGGPQPTEAPDTAVQAD
jgi:hypothetical protein